MPAPSSRTRKVTWSPAFNLDVDRRGGRGVPVRVRQEVRDRLLAELASPITRNARGQGDQDLPLGSASGGARSPSRRQGRARTPRGSPPPCRCRHASTARTARGCRSQRRPTRAPGCHGRPRGGRLGSRWASSIRAFATASGLRSSCATKLAKRDNRRRSSSSFRRRARAARPRRQGSASLDVDDDVSSRHRDAEQEPRADAPACALTCGHSSRGSGWPCSSRGSVVQPHSSIGRSTKLRPKSRGRRGCRTFRGRSRRRR